MKNHVRTSVKAVIIKNNQILLQIKRDLLSQYAVLPGGGQHKGETLPEALRRECLEEINADVEVGDLLFVRDYISDHHEFAEANGMCTSWSFFLLAAYQRATNPKPAKTLTQDRLGLAGCRSTGSMR